jgi:hypothetical protein
MNMNMNDFREVENKSETVRVSLTVTAAAWHQMGATIPKSLQTAYENCEVGILDIVAAILDADDQWTGDWDHDDFNAEDILWNPEFEECHETLEAGHQPQDSSALLPEDDPDSEEFDPYKDRGA